MVPSDGHDSGASRRSAGVASPVGSDSDVCFVPFQINRNDFNGFKKLFHRFLQVKGPAVDWAKINRPPEETVSSATFRTRPLASGGGEGP